MEDKVEYCTNCKRHIAVANYVIHSVHCERNIQLCDRCEEPVPRSEIERHLEENHSIHACSVCEAPMEKWLIEKHKSSCPKRLTCCEFCKLEVPLDELQEHATACGSRTERCIICKKHVMIKDLVEHPILCQKSQEEEICGDCGFRVAKKFFIDHVSVCKGRELYGKENQNEEYNCEMCGLKVPLNNVEVHMSVCRGHDSLKKKCEDTELVCYYCGLKVPASLFGKHTSQCRNNKISEKNSEEVEITCEFCEFKVPFNIYEEHRFVCGTVEEECLICNENVKAEDKKRHIEICRKVKYFKQKIQCKYCDESISEDEFKDHVLHCESRIEKCEKCNKYVVLKEKEMHPSVCKRVSKTHGNCSYCNLTISWLDMNVHEAACSLENRTTDYIQQNMLNELSLKKGSPYEKGLRNDEISNQVHEKRCLFCKRKFPQSRFPKHLEGCEERPYNCSECLKAMPYKEKEKHNKFLCHGNKETKGHFEALASYEENKFIDEDMQLKKLKRCHFCDERFPDLIFEAHLSTCSKRHEKCKLCNSSVLVQEMKDHYMFSCLFTKHDDRYLDCDKNIYAENMPTSSKSYEHLKHLEKNVEECPCCKCKVPFVRFARHTQYCLEGMKSCTFCGSNIQKREERTHLQNCKKLLDACTSNTLPSDKKDSMEHKSNYGRESLLGSFGKWFQNKGKKEASMEQNQSNYAFRGTQNRRKIQGSVIPNEPPQNVIPLVPCEFCDELYPFEVLIEHQSGCRPDLVSYPKKDEHEDLKRYMHEDDKSQSSYKYIANANSKKMEGDWIPVSSRKNRKTLMKKGVPFEKVESSPDRGNQSSKESGFSGSLMNFKQVINRDKYFYYPPSGYAEIEGNCVDKNKEKHFSVLNLNTKTSNIEYPKECDSERLGESLLGRSSFQSYKLDSSADTKEDYDSPHEQFGSSTDDEHNQHQLKGKDFYYQIFPVLPSDEKSILSKVVGAERVEKEGVINKTKNVALGCIYNENSKDNPIYKQVVSDDHAIKRNMSMKTVWNTECDTSNNHRKLSENNHEIKIDCNLLSNMENVPYIGEGRKHVKDETITHGVKENEALNKDSEMNAFLKYLSCSNEECFDLKEKEIEEKEKLVSDSAANCNCGNQMCYCAIADQSSLTENPFSNGNNNLKIFHTDSCIMPVKEDFCGNNDPKPMEVDSNSL